MFFFLLRDLCSEYSDQIYELWREAELRRVDFDHRSPQIDWRQHFIQFLFNLADTYQLTYGTLYLGDKIKPFSEYFINIDK